MVEECCSKESIEITKNTKISAIVLWTNNLLVHAEENAKENKSK